MDEISCKLAELKLPYKADENTPSDGNCFFHALTHQIKRPKLKITTKVTKVTDSKKLRLSICNFALNSKEEKVMTLRQNWDKVSSTSWNDFFKKIKVVGVWVESPIPEIAALYLNRDMHIISQGHNEENPYTYLNGQRNEQTNEYESTPILLYNYVEQHFQSLLHEYDTENKAEQNDEERAVWWTGSKGKTKVRR